MPRLKMEDMDAGRWQKSRNANDARLEIDRVCEIASAACRQSRLPDGGFGYRLTDPVPDPPSEDEARALAAEVLRLRNVISKLTIAHEYIQCDLRKAVVMDGTSTTGEMLPCVSPSPLGTRPRGEKT